MECEYCLLSFENEKLLKKHNTECETCNKYKNILFTCKKCDFSTIGIINIDNHIENNCVEKFDDISYEVISSASFKSDYRLCVDFIHIETFSSLFHLLFLYSFLLYFVVVVDTKLI